MLSVAGAARGHAFVIYTGAIEWRDGDLRLELQADPEADQHELDASGERLPAVDLLSRLARTIRIVTHQGAVVSAESFTFDPGSQTMVCSYRIPARVTALALRQVAGNELPPLLRQIQLRWRAGNAAGGNGGARLLRLTSGGNYEVIRTGAGASDARNDGMAPYIQPVLRVFGDTPAPQVAVQLDYPCSLLATWPGLVAWDGERISGAQVAQARAALDAWVRERLEIRVPATAVCAVTITRIDLIGPDDEVLNDDAHAYSIFTTRVRIELALPRAAQRGGATFAWRGFNYAVLRIPVIREQDQAGELAGFINAFDPAVQLPADATGNVRVAGAVRDVSAAAAADTPTPR